MADTRGPGGASTGTNGAGQRGASAWIVRARGARARHRERARRTRRVPPLSAWDRAIVEFGLAWRLSSVERTVLRLSLGTATQRLDRLVRALLVETAGLALDVGRPELAAWCYEACERVTVDAADRPTWDEVRLERPSIEALRPAVAHALSPESLVWWCVRLVPTLRDEGLEAACRRVTTYAFYLSVTAVQAFTADDVASRERAGLLAALGGVIARRARAMVAGLAR